MRIVGGRWRGRRLTPLGKGDPAAHLRPTTDRTRESLFNLLLHGGYADDLDGAQVLDVFAGTGALGLEALSRGAATVTFLENGRKSLGILRKNVTLLEADAKVIVRDARKPGAGTPHSLIFLDPPYGTGLGQAALAALGDTGWIAEDALIVLEDTEAVAPPDGFALEERRAFGETTLTLMRFTSRSDAETRSRVWRS